MKRNAHKIQPNGFSLTEVIIAIGIVVLVLAITSVLFSYSIKNIRVVEDEQKEQSVINADAANINRINQQFACADTVSCTAPPGTTASYPDEDSYIPDNYAETPATQAWLEQKCTSTINGFGDDLVAFINNTKNVPIDELAEFNIERNAKRTNNFSQEYTVEWNKTLDGTQTLLKRLTLSPKITAWCP